MNTKKQTPWLLIGLAAAAICLASLYVIRHRKPSLMETMQQPATGIDSALQDAAAPKEEPLVYELTDPCCIDYIKTCGKPCVIKFYATWCGACNHLASYYEEVAKEFKGKVEFYSLDCEKQKIMEKAEEAHLTKETVQHLPTLIFFQEGKVHEQIIGAVAQAELVEKIKKAFDL